MASDERDLLLQNLRRLHLSHAARDLDNHLRQAAQLKLGHLGFLARVMEAEVLARTQTGAQRRIDQAHFPEICRLEDYDFKCSAPARAARGAPSPFGAQPTLDRKQVLDLAELGFIDHAQSVLWIGPSGVGKTHLAIALGVRACSAGYSVAYVRAYDLFRHLWAAMADNTIDEVLGDYADPHVLIIDDLTHSPRKPEEDFAAVFYELVQRRYRRGSFIVSTNLGFSDWGPALGTPALVTPAIDRLIEAAHIITFPPDAPSYRAHRHDPPGRLPPDRRARRRRRARGRR